MSEKGLCLGEMATELCETGSDDGGRLEGGERAVL